MKTAKFTYSLTSLLGTIKPVLSFSVHGEAGEAPPFIGQFRERFESALHSLLKRCCAASSFSFPRLYNLVIAYNHFIKELELNPPQLYLG